MTSRLTHVDRDLDELLRTAEPRTRMAGGLSASQVAIRVCNVTMPSDADSATDRHAYAASLDKVYFDLNDAGDDRAQGAFAAARAATSSAFAADGRAEEAVYEAIVATGDLTLVRAHVLAVVRDLTS